MRTCIGVVYGAASGENLNVSFYVIYSRLLSILFIIGFPLCYQENPFNTVI